MSEHDSALTEGASGLPLTPLDEAHLARARTLTDLASDALDDLTQPATQTGATFLSHAQHLLELAERLIRETVIVHRERGESWEEIADQAGISRQAAHDRWADTVAAWTLVGRRRTGIGATPADILLPGLDEWFQQYDPRPRPISSTVASYTDPAARVAAQRQREQAAQLRTEADDAAPTTIAYNAYMEAVGTAAADEKRAAWAAAHLTRANLYDRLAAAEEPMGAEAKRTAAKQRAIAQEILTGTRGLEIQHQPAVTRARVQAAYDRLSTEARATSTKKALAQTIAADLDDVSVATVRKHLDAVVKEADDRRPEPVPLSECTDVNRARQHAAHLLWPNKGTDYWGDMAHRFLAGYLMAAAVDGQDLDTVLSWVTHPGDRRPLDLLQDSTVPAMGLWCEDVLTAALTTRDQVLLIITRALQDARQTSAPDTTTEHHA